MARPASTLCRATSADAARVELFLADLRLPAIKQVWATLAEQSDKEGCPAARFLAALAEHEIADRGRRRIERHLAEARLPVGCVEGASLRGRDLWGALRPRAWAGMALVRAAHEGAPRALARRQCDRDEPSTIITEMGATWTPNRSMSANLMQSSLRRSRRCARQAPRR
jgi:hypothetical protein